MAQLKTGYPRFFIPRIVEHFSRLIIEYAASLQLLPSRLQGDRTARESQTNVTDSSTYSALLLVNLEGASLFRSYLLRGGIVSHRSYHFRLDGCFQVVDASELENDPSDQEPCIYVVIYPTEAAAEGKSFWQHAGLGISSRCATYWLQHGPLCSQSWPAVRIPASLPMTEAEQAKARLRSRIPGLATNPKLHIESNDVSLYPTGMSAIGATATVLQSIQSLRASNEEYRVAIFGFVRLQNPLCIC